MGFTVAYFNLSGKTPELKAALQIWAKGETINGEFNFMIQLEISSYPDVFLEFRDLIVLSISYIEAYWQFILEKGILWYLNNAIVHQCLCEKINTTPGYDSVGNVLNPASLLTT